MPRFGDRKSFTVGKEVIPSGGIVAPSVSGTLEASTWMPAQFVPMLFACLGVCRRG